MCVYFGIFFVLICVLLRCVLCMCGCVRVLVWLFFYLVVCCCYCCTLVLIDVGVFVWHVCFTWVCVLIRLFYLGVLFT